MSLWLILIVISMIYQLLDYVFSLCMALGAGLMAFNVVCKAILAGEPIKVFNHGRMARDFTYIDDIVEGVLRVLAKPATAAVGFDAAHPDPAASWAPHRVFNIGNSSPTPLLDFIAALENALGRKAVHQFEPMQPGDVEATAADASALESWVGFRPATPMVQGVTLLLGIASFMAVELPGLFKRQLRGLLASTLPLS